MKPVERYCHEQHQAAREAIRALVPQVTPERWAALGHIERDQLASALYRAVDLLMGSSENLRQLPRTTACVCRHCGKVTLAARWSGASFDHCGHSWTVGSRGGFQMLPPGFWDTAMPGDDFKGLRQAAWAEEEEVTA